MTEGRSLRAALRFDSGAWRRFAELGCVYGPEWWKRASPPVIAGVIYGIARAQRRAVLRNHEVVLGPRSWLRTRWDGYRAFADTDKRYSARTMKLVERSLVIDMLAPLKIDFRPEAYAGRISEADEKAFRASGITGFHNAIGTGGPAVVEETLDFIAGWQGFVGRNSHLFTLVSTVSDLDRAAQCIFRRIDRIRWNTRKRLARHRAAINRSQ